MKHTTTLFSVSTSPVASMICRHSPHLTVYFKNQASRLSSTLHRKHCRRTAASMPRHIITRCCRLRLQQLHSIRKQCRRTAANMPRCIIDRTAARVRPCLNKLHSVLRLQQGTRYYACACPGGSGLLWSVETFLIPAATVTSLFMWRYRPPRTPPAAFI